MFIGYEDYHSGNVFRVYDIKTNSLRIERDIVWLKVFYVEWKYQKINIVDMMFIIQDKN